MRWMWNLASDSLNPTVTLSRLDWSRAFDLDGDGGYDDVLDPGAELPTPVDLSIDYPSSLQLRGKGVRSPAPPPIRTIRSSVTSSPTSMATT
jgi:hypothetical protein